MIEGTIISSEQSHLVAIYVSKSLLIYMHILSIMKKTNFAILGVF